MGGGPCYAKGCRTGRDKPEPGKKLEKFPIPQDNPILRNRWLRGIGKLPQKTGEKPKLPPKVYVCELHFREVS